MSYPAPIRAKLRPILVGPVVDILGKPIKFLNEIAKGDGFEPRHSRQLPSQDVRCQPASNPVYLLCFQPVAEIQQGLVQ